MKKNKSALTPVIAISLLLIVSVIGVVGFQSWYNNYSTSIFSNVNSQTTAGISSISIEILMGSNLYLKNSDNKNFVINSIKINDINRYVSGKYKPGLNRIFLGNNCSSDLNGKSTTIIILTPNGILEQTITQKEKYSNPCPTGFILVPGNSDLDTSNFCVMKYEAKATNDSLVNLNDSVNMYCGDTTDDGRNIFCPIDGSVNIISKPEYKPLTQVNQMEARELCENLGVNYALITDSQWVTIGRNIEKISSNWADGIIGSLVTNGGGLKRGNVGVDDSVSYNAVSDPADRSLDTNPKAMLTLSNSEDIWDFSGNVWEWTNDTFNTNIQSALGQESSGWKNWGMITEYDYLESSNSTYDSTYGIGSVYVDFNNAYPSGNIHGFLRGGNYYHTSNSGIFSLYLNLAPSGSYYDIGFRCVYNP